MGFKLSCVALDIIYKDENDKYKKIENIYHFMEQFLNFKNLNNNLKPNNWIDIYKDSIKVDKNSISYQPFYYNHIDAIENDEYRTVVVTVYSNFIRFWIGDDATECLDWEYDMFEQLLKASLIDTVSILIPSNKYTNLSRGTVMGKKNLLILYAILKFYRGEKKDIIQFLSKNEKMIYKDDKIIAINRKDLKQLLKKEQKGFFSILIKKCFLFKHWFKYTSQL